MRILAFIFLALVLLTGCKQEKKLPSGYKYLMHTRASGKGLELGDFAYARIQVRNNDSVVFSQTEIVPLPDSATFAQPSPQKHLFEALLRMKEKDSVTVFIPLDTIPEEQKMEGFKNAKIMYLDITLKQVIPGEDVKKFQEEVEKRTTNRDEAEAKAAFDRAKAFLQKTAKEYKAGTLKDIKTTASGLKYLIHEPGTGEPFKNDQFVYLDYCGGLTNGEIFDNSFDKPRDFSFVLGRQPLIEGWNEGLKMVKKGMKVSFFIPSKLGYGPSGNPPTIPGDAELVFYIEGHDAYTPPAFIFLGSSGQ